MCEAKLKETDLEASQLVIAGDLNAIKPDVCSNFEKLELQVRKNYKKAHPRMSASTTSVSQTINSTPLPRSRENKNTKLWFWESQKHDFVEFTSGA